MALVKWHCTFNQYFQSINIYLHEIPFSKKELPVSLSVSLSCYSSMAKYLTRSLFVLYEQGKMKLKTLPKQERDPKPKGKVANGLISDLFSFSRSHLSGRNVVALG